MSNVAKIFAFIVAVAAIALASASYVFVKNAANWKDKHDALVKTSGAEIERLKGVNEAVGKERDDAKALATAKAKEADDTQKELDGVVVRREELQKRYEGVLEDNKKLTASLTKIEDTLDKQAGEISLLRKEKDKFRTEAEAAQRAQEAAEDNLALCKDALNIAQKQLTGLNDNLKRKDGIIGQYEEKAPAVDIDKTVPNMPDINGKVVRVDNKAGIVMISVGKDDGVTKDFSFEVYRANQYVGRVWAHEVYGERTNCLIDRAMTEHDIMENDYVSTKLQ